MTNDKLINNNSLGPMIIAETAFSHQGSVNYLLNQIQNLQFSDNIAIKFQILIDYNDYFLREREHFDKTFPYLFSETDWIKILSYALSINSKIIVAALDLRALSLLEPYKKNIFAVELHPSCVSDLNFVNHVQKFCFDNDISLIVGISGFSLEEIDYLYYKFFIKIKAEKLIFMYGFQDYPTKMNLLNIQLIKFFKKKYNIEVGYADHTKFNSKQKSNLIYMLHGYGIKYFEIHYVLKFGENRIDYISAYDTKRILNLSNNIKELSNLLNKDFKISEEEIRYAENFQKIALYKDDFSKKHIINYDDLIFRRTSIKSKIKLLDLNKIEGKHLRKKVFAKRPVEKEDFE